MGPRRKGLGLSGGSTCSYKVSLTRSSRTPETLEPTSSAGRHKSSPFRGTGSSAWSSSVSSAAAPTHPQPMVREVGRLQHDHPLRGLQMLDELAPRLLFGPAGTGELLQGQHAHVRRTGQHGLERAAEARSELLESIRAALPAEL